MKQFSTQWHCLYKHLRYKELCLPIRKGLNHCRKVLIGPLLRCRKRTNPGRRPYSGWHHGPGMRILHLVTWHCHQQCTKHLSKDNRPTLLTCTSHKILMTTPWCKYYLYLELRKFEAYEFFFNTITSNFPSVTQLGNDLLSFKLMI